MSKTAAEWWECTPGPLNWPEPAATNWIQAIIDDARAGMVPEGELIDERARHLHTAEDRSTWMRNACDLRDERDAARTERDALRGELATVLSERDGAVSIGTQLERERDAAVSQREADCIQPVYTMDEDGVEYEAPCECCERRGKPSGQLEAELAKAWEAGWKACQAAALMEMYGDEHDGNRIRALQPPRGKAK